MCFCRLGNCRVGLSCCCSFVQTGVAIIAGGGFALPDNERGRGWGARESGRDGRRERESEFGWASGASSCWVLWRVQVAELGRSTGVPPCPAEGPGPLLGTYRAFGMFNINVVL